MSSTFNPLHFVSQNPFKAEEVIQLGILAGIDVIHVQFRIEELQTADIDLLIRDKTLKAFASLMRPVVVDHSGIHLDCLEGMPGGLTQLFWDNLNSKLCDIARNFGNNKASASTIVGYCDGYKLHVFKSRLKGVITEFPRGSRYFQWDTIFVPHGESLTYGEMSVEQKNNISQRRKAFEELFQHIKQI